MTSIDARVDPAFYAVLNAEPQRTELRHRELQLWKNSTPPLEHVVAQLECAGLDRLMLFANVVAGGPELVSNEEVAQVMALDPTRFSGVASVDPFAPGAVEELQRAFTDLGLRALFLNPSRGHYYPSDERLAPVLDVCERADRPVVFASGLCWEPGTLARYSRPTEFEELAFTRPRLRFCLTQLGWPWVPEAAMLAIKYPNVHLDTGMLYSGSAREWYRRVFTVELAQEWVDRSLRHQIMFASGAPRFEQIRMAKALDDLPLRASTIDLIRGATAEEFFFGGGDR